ncbi:MAG: carbon-nitrogen hydrolase family protein [Spirochaetes bacterium]|nr:carbon-nitrogen hydrolase family protein [Spirochaetota bacterium]
MRVAVIQLNSQNDWHANFAAAEAQIKAAAATGATYALLPENFAFFGSEDDKRAHGGEISAAATAFLAHAAKEYVITITGGGFPIAASSGKFYNSALTFAPDGKLVHQYDKLHLFDVSPGDSVSYRESATTESGQGELSLIALPPFAFGMTICYDVRFAALYRKYAQLGANVLCVPAAFTELTGRAHWQTLLRARAIENTCYVLAAAQVGAHGKRQTYGHSMVIDPWGEIVAEITSETPGFCIADLAIERVDDVRRRMPSLYHDRRRI